MIAAARSAGVPTDTSRAIDVTRGLAALGVIWGHAVYGFATPLELNGAFWVWIFLPLSGYLVAKSFDDGGYGRTLAGYRGFLRNRVLRIVPLAWIALAAGIAIEGASSASERSPDVWRQFLFVPPGNSMTLSGPLWTVAAEMQFYVAALLVCVAALSRKRRLAGWALFTVSLWVASQQAVPGGQPRTLLGNMPFFLFGVALAAGRHDGAVRLPNPLAMTGMALLVAGAWYLNNFRPDYFWGWGPYRSIPFGGAAACAVGVAALAITSPASLAQAARVSPVARALAWCGFHTYGIYVYHSILAKTNNTLLHLPPGVLLLSLLLLSVAVAPLSYRLIERPLLRFKVRRGRARDDLRDLRPAASIQVT